MGRLEVPALADVSLEVLPGEFVAIYGPSGSGKSTLMNILGCLDHPASGGHYLLDGVDVSPLTDKSGNHWLWCATGASASCSSRST